MKKYILNKQVKLKHDEASDKFYAFCIETGDHFILNKTGYNILRYFDEGKDLTEIVELIHEESNVDEKTVLTDTLNFLEKSEKNGILVHIK